MTSLAFKSLLTLSLAGNGALVFVLWTPAPKSPEEIPPAATAIVPRGTQPSPIAGETPTPPIRPPATSEADRALLLEAVARFGKIPAMGDPPGLVARMYREGYPDDVITAVVSTLLDEWTGYKAIQEARKQGNATAHRVSAVFSGGGALQKYMQDLFPQWREQAELRQTRERELRFPGMPLEKVQEVERLEKELRLSDRELALAQSRGEADVDAKLREALAQVLTPGELTDYLRFNSTVAKRLQSRISSIEIDEATYDRLLALEIARSAERGPSNSISDYRGILTDDQFVQLIPRGGDTSRAQADEVYRAAGLSNAQRAEFFVLADGIVGGGRDPSQPRPSPQAVLEQIRAALAVSPENAARFEALPLARSLKGSARK